MTLAEVVVASCAARHCPFHRASCVDWLRVSLLNKIIYSLPQFKWDGDGQWFYPLTVSDITATDWELLTPELEAGYEDYPEFWKWGVK